MRKWIWDKLLEPFFDWIELMPGERLIVRRAKLIALLPISLLIIFIHGVIGFTEAVVESQEVVWEDFAAFWNGEEGTWV